MPVSVASETFERITQDVDSSVDPRDPVDRILAKCDPMTNPALARYVSRSRVREHLVRTGMIDQKGQQTTDTERKRGPRYETFESWRREAMLSREQVVRERSFIQQQISQIKVDQQAMLHPRRRERSKGRQGGRQAGRQGGRKNKRKDGWRSPTITDAQDDFVLGITAGLSPNLLPALSHLKRRRKRR